MSLYNLDEKSQKKNKEKRKGEKEEKRTESQAGVEGAGERRFGKAGTIGEVSEVAWGIAPFSHPSVVHRALPDGLSKNTISKSRIIYDAFCVLDWLSLHAILCQQF